MGWLIRPSLCPALVTCLKETPKKLHSVQMVAKISNPTKGCTLVLKLVARLQGWERPFIIGEFSLYRLALWKNSYLEGEKGFFFFFLRKQCRKVDYMSETRITHPASPPKEALFVISVITQNFPWHVKTFWHIQLKEFHSEVKSWENVILTND